MIKIKDVAGLPYLFIRWRHDLLFHCPPGYADRERLWRQLPSYFAAVMQCRPRTAAGFLYDGLYRRARSR